METRPTWLGNKPTASLCIHPTNQTAIHAAYLNRRTGREKGRERRRKGRRKRKEEIQLTSIVTIHYILPQAGITKKLHHQYFKPEELLYLSPDSENGR